jgi:cytochrome c553
MRLRLLIILAASLVTIGAGNADSGKDKVAACAACHGQDGNSMVGLWPSLAGQNVNYLVRQLQHIKSGKRPITEMIGSLDNFAQEDLEDIAAFMLRKIMLLVKLHQIKLNWEESFIIQEV